jgi:hypothetical protein
MPPLNGREPAVAVYRLLPGAFITPAKTSTAPTGPVHRVGWDSVPRSLPSSGDLTKVARYEVPGIERRISRPRRTIETLVPEPPLGHYLLFSAPLVIGVLFLRRFHSRAV